MTGPLLFEAAQKGETTLIMGMIGIQERVSRRNATDIQMFLLVIDRLQGSCGVCDMPEVLRGGAE